MKASEIMWGTKTDAGPTVKPRRSLEPILRCDVEGRREEKLGHLKILRAV